jgi:D-alanine-D-alanine ligase
MKTKQTDAANKNSDESSITVGVVRGGDSEEREISLKTGKAVASALSDRPCTVQPYDTSPDLGETLKADGIDVVFLALHGKGGEDGTIQAMLEWRGIPFTGPGSKPSALCMDKLRTRQVFERIDVPAPDWFRLGPGDEIVNRGKFDRMVIKPRAEGSSLGMSIVDGDELESAVVKARNFDDDVVVEEYVSGYEVTVGVFGGDSMTVLPPVGIRPTHEFFDYETKYTKGLTEYDVPADLPENEVDELKALTERIVREAETEELCRVDFIRDNHGQFQFLEINTIPGLTETSLLPKAASEQGIEFDELVWKLIQTAWRD